MSEEPNSRQLWWGVLVGVAPGVLSTLASPFTKLGNGINPAAVLFFLAGISVWPLAALTFALTSGSRRFGLGMLLGVGLGGLVMFTLCGRLR